MNIPVDPRAWFDSFANFLSGFGVSGRDRSMSSHWTLNVLSMGQVEYAYRSDWVARKIVTIPAFDGTRAWRAWQATQDQIEKIEEAERLLSIQLKVMEVMEKSRLYGGAAMVLGVDSGKFNEELDVDKIEKGDLKFVHVVSRWTLAAGPLVRDITSPWWGEPTYYMRSNVPTADPPGDVQNVGLPTMGYSPGEQIFIHPSRVVRFLGLDYPDMERAPDQWGDTALQPVADAIKDAAMVSSSIAHMVGEAKQDIITVPGLTSKLQTTQGTTAVLNRFSQANAAKSVINALLLDKEEEWQRHELAFANMDKVMGMYLMICAAAADIPATRLLSKSPDGQNATGDSDFRNYYDRLKSDQKLRVTPKLSRLDEVLLRHVFGRRDKSIHYEWNSLWQQTEEEKAKTILSKAQSFKIDVDSGLINHEALSQARVNQLIEDGVYPGLEDAIEEFGEGPDETMAPGAQMEAGQEHEANLAQMGFGPGDDDQGDDDDYVEEA